MKFTELQQESRPQLVNRLILYIRTKDKDGFYSALERGVLYFGEEKLIYILENDFVPKLKEYSLLDTYIKWGDQINDDKFS